MFAHNTEPGSDSADRSSGRITRSRQGTSAQDFSSRTARDDWFAGATAATHGSENRATARSSDHIVAAAHGDALHDGADTFASAQPSRRSGGSVRIGYTSSRSHSSHSGHGYSSHFGFGYGYHYRPGYSISLHHGSGYYPYYSPYSSHRNYTTYTYGYGYSPYYRGYYSRYYDYAPAVTYTSYDNYYAANYRTDTVYTSTSRPPTSASRNAPVYNTVPSYADQPYSEGWVAISNGAPSAAFRYFSRKASANSDDGLPKLGYALSAALLGDHGRAVWAMRRAFDSDPYSLTSMRFDGALLKPLDQLAEHYADRADAASNPDSDFMLAAISLLIEDYDLARVAIQSAIDRGDRSQAAQALSSMIPAADDYDQP